MRAVSYAAFGPAADVLDLGTLPTPTAGQGEVLVRLHASGINPSDVKLRAGARPGAKMEYPKIIPHSDGAGIIEAVGEGVDPHRVRDRVWIWNGNWQRAFGTAAEYIAIPADQAVSLPESTSFAQGACLGIPAMTAAYALLGSGPIEGKTVLVTGGAGTVGRYACQMAQLLGARVITSVSSAQKAAHSLAPDWVNYRDESVVDRVMDMTSGQGVDLIVDVDFGANQSDSLALIKPGGTIASYASAASMTPELQFYGFMFKNVTLRMLIVYQLQGAMRRSCEAQLNEWLKAEALSHAAVPVGGLEECAKGHLMVEAGQKLGTAVLEF